MRFDSRYCSIIGIVGIILIVGIIYFIQSNVPVFLSIYVIVTVITTIVILLIFTISLRRLSEDISKSELEFEDVDDLEERIETYLNQANLVFNRLENSILSLKSRISTFFAILITTIALLIPLLQIFLTMYNGLTIFQWILFVLPFIILMLISGILICHLFWTTEYNEIELFTEKRFNQISNSNKQNILIDFLFYTRQCYDDNYEIYSREIYIFKSSFIFFIVGILSILVGMSILFIKTISG